MDESRRETLQRLERALGCRPFQDRSLLDTALTHRSFVNENRRSDLSDNERLEFLGDAVLQLSVSDLLYRRFPDSSEGDLSRIRASLVTEQSLARLARHYDLGNYLLLGRGENLSGGRDKDSILADAFEAVIAAVFLEHGYEEMLVAVEDIIAPVLDAVTTAPGYNDFKSHLQEISHRLFQSAPQYRVVETSGPDHDRIYLVEVRVGAELKTTGSGKSKKEAEQLAAGRALEYLDQSGGGETP